MSLSKKDILAAVDVKTEPVEVPEWGGSVFVRTMTGADRDGFESSMIVVQPDGTRKADMSNLRAKLVALTTVDEDGNRLFEVSDIDALSAKSSTALDRVFNASQKLNGLGFWAVDESAKNSPADLSENSTSV